MDTHGKVAVAPNGVDGKQAPVLWACVVLLIAAFGFCGAQAWREVPSTWAELHSYDVVPTTAFERIEEADLVFGLTRLTRSEALFLDKNEPLPAALRPLLRDRELPIHADLKLGFERILALNKNSARWTVSVFDEQVVRIASPERELLSYREFQDAHGNKRVRLTAIASVCALLAALLAAGLSRRLRRRVKSS
ncbi:hypothetical protein ACG02S_19555 [Roseateles sp. DC23W]|uniref:Uncharacterized protein n=1 Tax=Pelomonas dachongensis TaxID=3299029 RepID=A0ABW7ERG2_9BURK